ncbi:MAG: NDP-sugar synthase [Pseudomonadota bacterium]
MKVTLTCFKSGTSFGPLTQFKPVALLPVLNIPLIQRQIEICVSQGFKDIDIAVVDNPVAVRSFVGDGRRWGASIRVWTFRDPCSSLETVARLSDKIEGPIMVLPVEHCLNYNIGDLSRFHQSHEMKITRLLCACELKAVLETEQKAKPVSSETLQKPVDSGLVLIDSPNDINSEAENIVFSGSWIPINSPRHLWTANMAFLDGLFPVLTDGLNTRNEIDLWVGHHSVLDPTSITQGPALIGDFSSVRSNAQVGPYSVIGNGSIIDKEAHVSYSLILNHVYVGTQTTMNLVIVSNNNIMNLKLETWVTVTDPFLVSSVRKKILVPWTVQLFNKGIAALLLVLTSPLWLFKGVIRIIARKPFFDRSSFFNWDSSSGIEGLSQGENLELLTFNDSKGLVSRLPGLIDVVRGRLALVGVRPLHESAVLTYTDEWTIPRFSSPVGLFTPVDAELMNDSLDEEKIIAENLFAAKRSFRQDLQVFFKSLKNLVFHRR